jgi:hypothetical protein
MGDHRGDGRVPHEGTFDWEDAGDLTALPEDELRARREALTEEERVLSYRRALLHGMMDELRADHVQRGALASSPEEPARVLSGELGERRSR